MASLKKTSVIKYFKFAMLVQVFLRIYTLVLLYTVILMMFQSDWSETTEIEARSGAK